MLRILMVRVDGFVETADTWGRMLRDEGHEVILHGSADAEPEIDRVVAVAGQEDADVVVVPGAEHDWRHALKERLHEDDVGIAPPECDGADLLEWVAKRDEGGHTEGGA
ncbi:hypothetical protein GCM10011519_32140 [Marmoricola endophyticus]|uniref:Uncharacterized protein n=1 Tax=Marmoricola endophyticus TaxID=2040280 RepID=A0A917F6I7_9ACTN|nr:hypothetical protein [Marmoricola endophyticus]GGF55798.1 hypothetical protein GCM10011519_32140 [Marmoricola endophyticus]